MRRQTVARAAVLTASALLLGVLAWAILSARTTVVFEGESEFGALRVVERADGLRTLYMGEGRARQSAIYPGRPLHLELAYTRVGMVGLALAPPDGRILFVGLGGGAMPMYARQVLPEARIDVVEIDPRVVDLAERYFGFTPDARLAVHVADGRAFIEGAPAGSWDLVVLDAFSDTEIPRSLATLEFLRQVRTRLAAGGVVVSNVPTPAPEYLPMLATYAAVFPELHLLRVPRRAQRIVVAAGEDRPLDHGVLVRASASLAARGDLGFDLPRLVDDGYEPVGRIEASPLRDRDAATEDP